MNETGLLITNYVGNAATPANRVFERWWLTAPSTFPNVPAERQEQGKRKERSRKRQKSLEERKGALLYIV
jgi:hypothetical protein